MDHMNRKRSLAASISSRIFALHVACAVPMSTLQSWPTHTAVQLGLASTRTTYHIFYVGARCVVCNRWLC